MIKLSNRDFAQAIEVISRLTQESHDILMEMCERVRLSEDKSDMRKQVYDTIIHNIPVLSKGVVEVFVEDETVCEKAFKEALLDSYVLSSQAKVSMVLMGYNSQALQDDVRQLFIDLYDDSRIGIALEILTDIIQEKLDEGDVYLNEIDFNEFDPTVVVSLMNSKYKELTSFHK